MVSPVGWISGASEKRPAEVIATARSLPALHLLDGDREVVACQLDLAADQVLDALVGGAIGDRRDLDAGRIGEHLAAQVLRRADA